MQAVIMPVMPFRRMPRTQTGWLALLCVLMLAPLAAAQSLEDQLNAQYAKKVLFLRHPYASSSQDYDAQGELRGKDEEGPWPAYGTFRVDKIVLEEAKLRVEGDRVAYKFDKDATGLQPLFVSDPIKISIDLDKKPASMTKEDALTVLGRVVALNDQDELATVPARWKPYLSAQGESGKHDSCTGVSSSGASSPWLDFRTLTAPRARFTPAPQFSPKGKRSIFAAQVGLNAVIDTKGRACSVKVARSAGKGMDEEAILALKSWEFTPATRNGQPVPALMYIEIDFHH